MKKIAFFCLIFLFSLAGAFASQSREALTLPAAGCRALDIECGAGNLKVQGDDKLERIEVDAVLVVRGIGESDLPEFKKDHVTLKLEKSGDRAILRALIEEKFSLENLFGGREAYIDLHVRLPRRLALDIDDGSGDLFLTGVGGDVEIEDGSGDIELKDAGGDVEIEDGSGQMEVFNVRGSLVIDDGSGDIVIDGVEKDVTIEEAGSGDLEINNVKGRVKK